MCWNLVSTKLLSYFFDWNGVSVTQLNFKNWDWMLSNNPDIDQVEKCNLTYMAMS